jgi:imidazoleglycerol-phosphate dehydratase
MPRKASVTRKTKETNIKISLNLDGRGEYKVSTSVPFVDHMLSLMAKHGHMDLNVQAKGDIEVDYHHLIEDLGIVLGEAIKKALGKKLRIRRYGETLTPMDECLSQVAIDLSGRPYLVYKVRFPKGGSQIQDLGVSIFQYGRDPHHILEAVFKGFGRALRSAIEIHPGSKGVPSTKGTL